MFQRWLSCRLYNFLGLCVLLPNKMSIVYDGLFRFVDDLGELSNYNWKSVVYEYVVDSLCWASMCKMNQTNPSH